MSRRAALIAGSFLTAAFALAPQVARLKPPRRPSPSPTT